MGEEAQQAQAVVHRDKDDALLCEFRSVVERRAAIAEPEGAAMDPHHHREILGAGGREYVEREAILALRGRRANAPAIATLRLRTGRADCFGLAYAGPGLHQLRRFPAQVAERRRGEGNALE